MPTLEWIGKDKVVNHHQQVPFRVLERKYSFDENGQHAEDNGSENMIIKGDNLEALKQGMNMIIGEFDRALEELGVKKMKTVGEKFDPELHDAVGYEASDTVPEGCVIREWSGGFTIGEKLLRPARVLVSSGSAPADNGAEAQEKE